MQMSISVDKDFHSRKAELLSYLRFRAVEYLNEIKQEFGERQFRKRATAINRALAKEKQQLAAVIRQNAGRRDWQPEDKNNHYLQILKRSDLWEVYCGAETYPKVLEYSGFDLGVWMHENVTWTDDVSPQFLNSLEQNDLVKYLTW